MMRIATPGLSRPPIHCGHPVGGDLMWTAEEIAISALSASPQFSRFPLHGAWAVAAWLGGLPRPTRGIDLVDQERGSAEDVVIGLADALGPCPGGLALDWSAARVRTKAARRSPLHRISVPSRLGCRVLDLGINVTAARHTPPEIEFRPLCLAAGNRRSMWVACCTAEEIVAEKTALLVTYGSDHTRLQDVLDLWLMSERVRLDGPALVRAMAATFAGRDAARMLGRDDGYWEGAFGLGRITRADRNRWDSLLPGARSPLPMPDLGTVLLDLARFLVPVLRSVRHGTDTPAAWSSETGWRVEGIWEICSPRSGAGALPENLKAATVMMGFGRK